MAWPALQAPAASAETGLVTGQHREQTDRDTPARLLLSPSPLLEVERSFVDMVVSIHWPKEESVAKEEDEVKTE